MAIVAALAAAFFYAAASVLQQWEAERQPADQELKISLVARLARRPRWLVGLGLDVFGFIAQWLALSWGSLVVVQPLLVSGLLFALPLKARMVRCRFDRSDWAGAIMTTAGLAVFLTVSQPVKGRSNVDLMAWALILGVAALVAGPLLALGRGSSPKWKAMSFGTAGGVVYGVCAALTKTCSQLLSRGFAHLFTSWQPYVLIGAGAAGMVLAQSAFRAGPLDVSLPTLSATDPIVSVLIGAVAFGEAVHSGPVATPIEALAFATIVVGIFVLGRTEAVKLAQGEHTRALGREPQAAV